MSLGKLLATGRSLAGGPSAGRYNVSDSNRLPKFGSGKNPFAQPAPAGATPPQVEKAQIEKLPIEEAQASAPMIAPVAAADLKKTQRIPELADATRAEKVLQFVKRIIPATRNAGVALLAKLLAPFRKLTGRVRGVRRKQPASVIPRFGKPALQTELSLDNVKVVRNNLEESDLEIVTAQTDTTTQVAPTVAPATPNRGPVPPALKKLSSRRLGVKLS